MNFFEKMCENLAKNAEFFVEKCKNSRNLILNSQNLRNFKKNSSILNCPNLQTNSKPLNSDKFHLVSSTFLNLRKLKNVLA